MQTHDCNSMYSIHGLLSAMSHSRHDAHSSFWHTPSMHYPGKCIFVFYLAFNNFQMPIVCMQSQFSLLSVSSTSASALKTHIASSNGKEPSATRSCYCHRKLSQTQRKNRTLIFNINASMGNTSS